MSTYNKINSKIYQFKANIIIKKYEKALKEENTKKAIDLILGVNNYWGNCLNDITMSYRSVLENTCWERVGYGEKEQTLYDENITKCLKLAVKHNNSIVFDNIINNTISVYGEDPHDINSPPHFEHNMAQFNSLDILFQAISKHNFGIVSKILEKKSINIYDLFENYLNEKFSIDNKIADFFIQYNSTLKENFQHNITTTNNKKIQPLIKRLLENNIINNNNFTRYVLQPNHEIFHTSSELFKKNETPEYFHYIIDYIFEEKSNIVKNIIDKELNDINNAPLKADSIEIVSKAIKSTIQKEFLTNDVTEIKQQNFKRKVL